MTAVYLGRRKPEQPPISIAPALQPYVATYDGDPLDLLARFPRLNAVEADEDEQE